MPPSVPPDSLDDLAAESADLDGYFSDADLVPETPEYPPLNESMDSAILLLGIPKPPAAKLPKLEKFLVKVLSNVGPLAATEDFSGVYLPSVNEVGVGYALVNFVSPTFASLACEQMVDFELTKKDKVTAVPFSKAKALLENKLAEFAAPSQPPFVEKPNLTSWLEDEHQRDQFLIREGDNTAVEWFDATSNEPIVDYDGARETAAGVKWCESYAHWSTHGSHLASLVQSKGVILWSGPNYEKTGRFKAPGVRHVVFSPQENFLLTSSEDLHNPHTTQIFHVATGELKRTFPLYPKDMDPELEPPPPILWSHDDAYFAQKGVDTLSVYDASTFKILDQRSLITEGIADFAWCPHRNIIAYWAPESKNTPAHVDIVELPSRKVLRQKNLFHVSRCSMVFSPSGDYLAVKVTRHTKTKKTFYNNIELFRLNADTVPVEMLEVKDAVLALQWEPVGSRFAMIHAENPHATKVTVSLYDMMKRPDPNAATKKKNPNQRVPELNKIESLLGKQCNSIFWSPVGTTMIMASLGDSASGTLEFYNVDTKALVIKEHYRANTVLWDPAGRSVATCVTQSFEGGNFKFAMDNGFVLWSFQGKQLYSRSYQTFYQFAWRPRESMLTKTQIKKIRRNLATYEERFDEEDKRRERERYLEETKGKRAERAAFRQLLARNRATLRAKRAMHISLLGGYDSEDEAHFVHTDLTVEKILSTKEEVVLL